MRRKANGSSKINNKGYSALSMTDSQIDTEQEVEMNGAKSGESNSEFSPIPGYDDNSIGSIFKASHPMLPFLVLLVLKLLFDTRIELFLCIALFITCFKVDALLVELTAYRRNCERAIRAAQLFFFLLLNLVLLFLVYNDERIYRIFFFMKPSLSALNNSIQLEIFDVIFFVAIADFIIKMATMMIKCLVYLIPSTTVPKLLDNKGWTYLCVELMSQLYRTLIAPVLWIYMLLQMNETSEYIFNILLIIIAVVFKLIQLKSTIQNFVEHLSTIGKETYQAMPVETSNTTCPICQGAFVNPVITGQCMHVFCHKCLATWCNRDRKCPICKEVLVSNSSVDYRDGHTGQYLQLF